MTLAQVLAILEDVVADSGNPDIAAVERFGKDAEPGGLSPAGVAVKYLNGAEAYLWGAEHLTARPADLSDPPPTYPASSFAIWVAELLDNDRPPQFHHWTLAEIPGLVSPCGVYILATDGTPWLLRVTIGSA